MVLGKLLAAFPGARISVGNQKRQNSESDEVMDAELLASPQLDRLEYTIFVDCRNANIVASEWPLLIAALHTGGSCQSLRLHIENRHDVSIQQSKSLAGFQLPPGGMLSPLEELSLHRMSYWGDSRWDIPHCALLKDILDWSRMRVLDFGSSCPMAFFEALTGSVPNLKSLTFDLPPKEEPLGMVPQFLETIPGLEALHIGNLVPHVESMWPVIKKHSATLESLVVKPCRSTYTFPMYMDFEYWNSVGTDFPHLRHLGIDVPFKQEKKGLKGAVVNKVCSHSDTRRDSCLLPTAGRRPRNSAHADAAPDA